MNVWHLWRVCLACVFVVGLTACGNGGGGNNDIDAGGQPQNWLEGLFARATHTPWRAAANHREPSADPWRARSAWNNERRRDEAPRDNAR